MPQRLVHDRMLSVSSYFPQNKAKRAKKGKLSNQTSSRVATRASTRAAAKAEKAAAEAKASTASSSAGAAVADTGLSGGIMNVIDLEISSADVGLACHEVVLEGTVALFTFGSI